MWPFSKRRNKEWIEINSKTGELCITGTEIPVDSILEKLADGQNPESLIQQNPGLNPDSIHACLMYAAQAVRGDVLPPSIARAMLLKLMTELSQEIFSEPWAIRLDFRLQQLLEDRIHDPDKTDERLLELEHLVEQAGGWYSWSGKFLKPVFIPVERWRERYENYRKKYSNFP